MNMLVTIPQSEIDTSRREGEIVEQEGGNGFIPTPKGMGIQPTIL